MKRLVKSSNFRKFGSLKPYYLFSMVFCFSLLFSTSDGFKGLQTIARRLLDNPY